MKPIDPLEPLSLSSQQRTSWRWWYLVLLILGGCLLVWMLLSRANAPEEGGVREVGSLGAQTGKSPALLLAPLVVSSRHRREFGNELVAGRAAR